MTIKNFYLVMACALWFGFLMLLWIKMAWDHSQERKTQKKKQEMETVFSPGCSEQIRRALFEPLGRYIREENMLHYLFDCYKQNRLFYSSEEKDDMKRYATELLHRRMETEAEDPQVRSLIVYEILTCQLQSQQMDAFLKNPQNRSLFLCGWEDVLERAHCAEKIGV